MRHSVAAHLGVLLVLCSKTVRTTQMKVRFHHVQDKDGVLFSQEPLFQQTNVEEMDCARRCVLDGRCLTFSLAQSVGDGAALCLGYSSPPSLLTSSGSEVSGVKTYTVPTRATLVEGCDVLLENSRTEGIIELWPLHSTFLGRAFCHGPWLVFQRRQSGTVDFYRGWDDYRAGFGDVQGEYWLGLETVRLLTSHGAWDLRVDLEDKAGHTAYASFSSVSLGPEDSCYPLLFHSYTGGTAGDSLSRHLHKPFSTFDNDHDDIGSNCAVLYHGAWWYDGCHGANLNGHYNDDEYGMGLNWVSWKGHYYSLPFTEMKIKKV